jgi:hypothetical protein
VLGIATAQRLFEEFTPERTTEKSTRWGEEHERIRIVLACRSRKKADVAVDVLRKKFPHRSLLLDIEDLDLCSMQNVENFCQRFLERLTASRMKLTLVAVLLAG